MGCDIPARYIFMALVFSGMFILTLLRANLSIAIILMAKPISSEPIQSDNNVTDVCPGEIISSYKNDSTGTVEWSSVQQGIALGCYYYGSMITSALGPWAAKRFGVKMIVGVSIVFAAIFTLLSPLAANHSFGAFVAIRTLAGSFLGPYFPTSVSAIPFWFGPKQHTSAFSLAASGFCIGYFTVLNVCSLLAEYVGWESVFYVSGSVAIAWSVMWILLMYNSPDQHPRLSKKEKEFLMKKIPKDLQKSSGNARVPWLSILLSVPYLAINISRLALEWTLGVTAVMLPIYLATVLKMNIAMVGISSSLPFLFVTVVILLGSKIVDVLRKKTAMSMTAIRKTITLTGLLGSAASILIASYASCNKVLSVVFFISVMQFSALHTPGTEANVFDLSPAYCGILLGLTLCVTGTGGFLSPLVAGYILDNNNTLSGWRKLFWITAGINVFAAVFYLIFGSAEEQPWSRAKDKTQAIDKEDEEEVKFRVDAV